MLYTKNQINKLIDKYDLMLEAVERFVSEKYPKTRRGDVRIKNGQIEEYVNTSCHCHPEYDWEDRGNVEDFAEWIKDKKGYHSTYYTKHES